MEIKAVNKKNCLIVRLKGDLDMHTVPVFKNKVIELMEKKKLNNLIINFKGVSFIDSTGIGAVLGRYRNINSQGGQLVLVDLNPQVKRIFELAGVLSLVPVYQKENKALPKVIGGNLNAK